MLPISYKRQLLHGIRDSKKLTEAAREDWHARAVEADSRGVLTFAVACVGAPTIDRRGIMYAIRTALSRVMRRLDAKPEECLVLLDGGLRAPKQFIYQQTIIRGEDRVPAIALASIVAKVHRDRKMVRFSCQFPGYAFEHHKGYGTEEHQNAIQTLGPCELHRRSFLHLKS
jgi:ribonuclease HII